MPSVCVFCGSSLGHDAAYANAARDLGQALAASKSSLVYGGGKVGLMGVLADEVLSHGGDVVGVIPEFLFQREVAHLGITKLEIVLSMHERKKKMADLADVFIAMPGGWGTLDELAEILTWKQLGLIAQPVGILNTNSFFSPLLEQFNRMTGAGFLKEANNQSLQVSESPKQLLTLLGVVAV